MILWTMDRFGVSDSVCNLITFHALLNAFPLADPGFSMGETSSQPNPFCIKSLKIDVICFSLKYLKKHSLVHDSEKIEMDSFVDF